MTTNTTVADRPIYDYAKRLKRAYYNIKLLHNGDALLFLDKWQYAD